MDLLKVRVSDISLIAFSLLVNEQSFTGERLTGELKKISDLQPSSFCYKVIHPNGAIIGLFCVPKDISIKKVSAFYIKETARVKEYQDAFWQLISDTVYGQVYESISRFNSENFVSLLSRNITILERKLFYGFDYQLNS